jgi:hypothetical protein
MTNKRVIIVGAAFCAAATTGVAGTIRLSGGWQSEQASHESTTAKASIQGDGVLAVPTLKPCLSVAPMPSHLPPRVNGRATECDTGQHPPVARPPGGKPIDAPGELVSSTQQVRRDVTYTLAGSINADTSPRQGATFDQNKLAAGAYHMRTDILFVTWTHATTLEPLGDGVVSVRQPLTSGGNARVTTMSDGLGPVRVEWSTGGNTNLLLTTHSITDRGPTGVSITELLAMAGSVH